MLEAKQLSVSYGRHRALDGVSVDTKPGEIVVILGANGAGKTTLLKAIAGLVPCAGQISMDGRAISAMPSHEIVETGLALVPEGRGIFGELSVAENLILGANARRARGDESGNLNRVFGLFPKLSERRNQTARTMSGGEQQMVAIGRALMSAPQVLMLDEPSLGLSPLLSAELFKSLASVRQSGVGVLLVEQNARQSLAIADRVYLLENGHIVGEGPAQEMMRNPAVQQAYLGGASGGRDDQRTPPKQAAVPIAKSAGNDRGQADVTQDAFESLSITPPNSSHHGASAIPENSELADMVSRATAIQREHIGLRGDDERRRSGATNSTQSNSAMAMELMPDIEAVLAGIEQSAQRALNTRDESYATAPASQGGRRPTVHVITPAKGATISNQNAGEQPDRPKIPVFRKPKIEIYRRRSADGPLERDN